MDKETIDFAVALTGHDEDTIRQMYSDWSRSPSNQPSRKDNVFKKWFKIADKLPPIGKIVFLNDGKQTWIGGRDWIEPGIWLWGNSYLHIWHNGKKWDGDLETDDDYKPLWWCPLPEPPKDIY